MFVKISIIYGMYNNYCPNVINFEMQLFKIISQCLEAYVRYNQNLILHSFRISLYKKLVSRCLFYHCFYKLAYSNVQRNFKIYIFCARLRSNNIMLLYSRLYLSVWMQVFFSLMLFSHKKTMVVLSSCSILNTSKFPIDFMKS